ncbi:MAG: LysM peptidoglycan-binding domain-containing protein [Mycobacteriales bacterium]
MSGIVRRGTLLGTATAALLLLAAAPSPQAALRQLHDAGPADPTAPVVAASALAAWSLAGWLAATVLVTVAGRLPGLAGRACAAVSRRVAPLAVRRAVEVALGFTVAVAGLGTSPASAAPDDTRVPAGTSGLRSAATASPLDWPVLPPLRTESPDRLGNNDPNRLGNTARPGEPMPGPPVTGESVLVRPGDCLWDIASRQLLAAGTPAPSDAAIAQAWPRWWAANRHVVGDDPDLLRPGMRLSPPPAG